MWRYIVRRLFWFVVTVLAVTVITFVITAVAPVDPVRLIVGSHAPLATVRAAYRLYGFDKPVWYRYGMFLWGFLHGNLGYSFAAHQTVASELAQAIPVTASIAIPAVLAEVVFGVPIGIVMATHENRWYSSVLNTLALLFYSLPTFWVGSVLVFLFAFKLGWFPLEGVSPANFVLPAVSIGLVGAAGYARILRASMIDVQVMDYVRTARAKGLHDRAVTRKHVLRNALIPFVTLMGLDLGGQLGGLIVTEVVFGLPGLGKCSTPASRTSTSRASWASPCSPRWQSWR